MKKHLPQQFHIPGTLTVLVKKDDGPIEQIDNLDGFRVCEDTGNIHYMFFDGTTWISRVLEGYTLMAMRANWGEVDLQDSYSFDLYLDVSEGSPVLHGIVFTLTSHVYGKSNQYVIGNITKPGCVKRTSHYCAPHHTLHAMINACKNDINRIVASVDDSLINGLMAIIELCPKI